MFWRVVTLLFSGMALAMLAVGVVSYFHGIPKNTLWINTAEETAHFRLAVVDGTIHAVYSEPRSVGQGLYDFRYGPFYVRRVGLGKVDATGVGGPWWIVCALLAIVPIRAFLCGPVRRWRRRRRGLCVTCGYSLKGNISGRCPECGTALAATASPEPS